MQHGIHLPKCPINQYVHRMYDVQKNEKLHLLPAFHGQPPIVQVTLKRHGQLPKLHLRSCDGNCCSLPSVNAFWVQEPKTYAKSIA